jgi:hypothetical protein
MNENAQFSICKPLHFLPDRIGIGLLLGERMAYQQNKDQK